MKPNAPQPIEFERRLHRRCGWLATLAALAGAAETTRVRCYERTEIGSDQILLGDIAHIEGGDAHFVRRLEAVVLGRAPLPGKTRELDKRPCSGACGRTESIRPARSSTAAGRHRHPAAMTVGREQIEPVIRAYVQQQTRAPGQSAD